MKQKYVFAYNDFLQRLWEVRKNALYFKVYFGYYQGYEQKPWRLLVFTPFLTTMVTLSLAQNKYDPNNKNII